MNFNHIKRKAQGLPIYAIVVIILAIIILALVILYAIMVTNQGANSSSTFIDMGKNITSKANETTSGFFG